MKALESWMEGVTKVSLLHALNKAKHTEFTTRALMWLKKASTCYLMKVMT